MSACILHILDYTDLGGGETSLLTLIAEARRATPRLRHAAIVRGPGRVEEALRALGVETHCVAYPCRLRHGPIPWFSPQAARQVDRVLERVAPAIVHANNFFGMLYAGAAARRRGIPLVWTCHGPFDIDTAAKRWAARAYATHVSCVSDAVRREVERHVTEPGRVSTDYLGLAPPETGLARRDERPGGTLLRGKVRAEFGIDDATPLIAVLGRFQPIKGHRLLLEALPEVWKRVPELIVWFIGDALFGSQEEAQEKAWIENEIRARDWGERVKLLGFRRDARELIHALDALVIPSRYESFSMTALEGMDAGIPVIGPAIGGPAELVDVPATGLLFEPGNARDLARRIIEIEKGEGEGAAFDPLAGPLRVAEHFSAAAHWGRTLGLYQKLASGPLA